MNAEEQAIALIDILGQLCNENPNNSDLGAKVRAIIEEFNQVNKQLIISQTDERLWCKKRFWKNGKDAVVETSVAVLGYLKNLAMRTDDDLELAKAVREILQVGASRRYKEDINGHTYEYLPADNKLWLDYT